MASFMRGLYQGPRALRQEYRAGGRASGNFKDVGLKQFEANRDKYNRNLVKLQDLLIQSIDEYGSSSSPADKQIALIYSNYLKTLSEGGGKARDLVKMFERGELPRLGKPTQQMPPAWS